MWAWCRSRSAVAVARVSGPTGSRCASAGVGSSTCARSPTAARHLENDAGEITDTALAGYIAKYATKGTGANAGTDRPIRDTTHVEHLDLTAHHRAMIETAWELGGHEQYEELNLRRWTHMRAFRGHFLTKSQRYSTTFRVIRGERRVWRLREASPHSTGHRRSQQHSDRSRHRRRDQRLVADPLSPSRRRRTRTGRRHHRTQPTATTDRTS